jgi:homoserine acetyltransferase
MDFTESEQTLVQLFDQYLNENSDPERGIEFATELLTLSYRTRAAAQRRSGKLPTTKRSSPKRKLERKFKY